MTYLIKLKQFFLFWDTLQRRPVSFRMTENEVAAYYERNRLPGGAAACQVRLERAKKSGTSAQPPLKVEDVIAKNRAGTKSESITVDQILELYENPLVRLKAALGQQNAALADAINSAAYERARAEFTKPTDDDVMLVAGAMYAGAELALRGGKEAPKPKQPELVEAK